MTALSLFDDARELIEIESITGNEEAVTACIESKVSSMGLPVDSQVVAPGRRNLIAGRPGARVLFCTHTDTVPPYVPFDSDENHLYGRGACDTKGITASMLEAGRRLLARGVDDFGYLWVVGEEVDNIGARAANRSVRCDHLVVGEPTENRLALGHKGCLGAVLRARGIAAHSAYPERGDSAIHRLLAVLERARAADFGEDPVLGEATLNVGRLRGGVASNVLAPEAEADILLRVVTDLDDARSRLLRVLVDPSTGQPDPRLELEFRLAMDRARTTSIDGFETTVVAYGTDIPFLKDVGRPYLIGPGSILDAHTAGEKISRRSMLEAVELYERLAMRLLDL